MVVGCLKMKSGTKLNLNDFAQPIGFFIGAGFTVEAGMPLVWEATNILKRWLTPTKLRQLNTKWAQEGEEFGFYPAFVNTHKK